MGQHHACTASSSAEIRTQATALHSTTSARAGNDSRGRLGIAHRFTLAEPDWHRCRAGWGFLLPQVRLRKQLDWPSRTGPDRPGSRACADYLEREIPTWWLSGFFVLAQGTWDRHSVSVLVGGVSGLQPDPRSSRIGRSEEHTSELQSQSNLVCRLLLEKKKKKKKRQLRQIDKKQNI